MTFAIDVLFEKIYHYQPVFSININLFFVLKKIIDYDYIKAMYTTMLEKVNL